jgi:DNA replication protein DnaC
MKNSDMEIDAYIQKLSDTGYFIDDRVRWEVPEAADFFSRMATRLSMQILKEYGPVIDWMVNNKGQGIVMYGSNGRGKSLIAHKILPPFFDLCLSKVVKCYQATEINENLNDILTRKMLIIDDMGTEDQRIVYGERKWAIPEIVDRAEQRENLLVITTNLTPEAIEKKYGIRTRERIRALCLPVLFRGDSLRKSSAL